MFSDSRILDVLVFSRGVSNRAKVQDCGNVAPVRRNVKSTKRRGGGSQCGPIFLRVALKVTLTRTARVNNAVDYFLFLLPESLGPRFVYYGLKRNNRSSVKIELQCISNYAIEYT